MAKYLFHGAYSIEGTKGVLKDGGSARVKAVKKLAESVGGKLESFYFAFGPDSYFIICDLPSAEAAAAIALTVDAAGTSSTLTTVVLLTPEQVDAAAKLTPTYRAPGQ